MKVVLLMMLLLTAHLVLLQSVESYADEKATNTSEQLSIISMLDKCSVLHVAGSIPPFNTNPFFESYI